MKNNIKLALIGGAGPYASALLYHSIVQALYREKKEIWGMLILNFPFTPPHACPNFSRYDEILCSELQECVDRILSLNIKKAVIVCNTLHAYIKKMQGDLDFIHLPELVKKEIVTDKRKRVLILGTEITIRARLYEDENYVAITPSKNEQKQINLIIKNVLTGNLHKEDGQFLETLISKTKQERAVDAVVLGCTELPVLHHEYPLKVPCTIFDPIEIFANHSIKLEKELI